jgi:anti-anti-sigma factor
MRDAPVGNLTISVHGADGVAIVRAEGEVDLGNAEKLTAALRQAGAGGDRVVCDLLGVPFMDSSGLRTLLVALAELGDRFSLVLSPGAPVTNLLELAEVRERFRIHGTPEEAIQAVGQDA